MQRIKQVILIRKDLKMRRGKEIAQGSHASMAFLVEQLQNSRENQSDGFTVKLSEDEKLWVSRGMAKVCLRVNSEEELLAYHEKARQSGLKSYLITDSGRTEFNGVSTLTACAIGPAEIEQINQVTGDLVPY